MSAVAGRVSTSAIDRRLIDALPDEKKRELWREIERRLGPLRLPVWGASLPPSAKQELFLRLDCLEAFYGGAAGPGKSTALLAGALQYSDVPGYSALLLRRTYGDLARPGALMDVARQWLAGTDARWTAGTKTWHFPSSATLTFGHLEHEDAKTQYRGGAYQFIGIDELTQFTETMLDYLLSVMRRPKVNVHGAAADGMTLDRVPIRMRSASNPGGVGHLWVRRRYVDRLTRKPGVVFVPAWMQENPGLDVEGYDELLRGLPPVLAAQLRHGDWNAQADGVMFKRTSLPIETVVPAPVSLVRSWDLAATEHTPGSSGDPDFTVGVLYSRDEDDHYTVRDVVRGQWGAGKVRSVMQAVASQDRETWRDAVDITVPQDPGQAGKDQAETLIRTVLRGYRVTAVRPTGSKELRARNVAAAVENGLVRVMPGGWLADFLDVLEGFPLVGRHDDDVDALSDAHAHVTAPRGMTVAAAPAQVQMPQRAKRA